MTSDFKRHSVPPPRTGLVEAYQARRPKVLVVGDLMLDRYLWGSTGRISPEAPVPVIDVQKQSCRLGGAGNVLENLITFGAEASIVSVIGSGPGRSTVVELVEGLGVATDGLFTDPSRSVTEKTRIIAGSQQVLRYDLETRQAITPKIERELLEHLERVVGGFQVIAVSDYNKGVLTETFTQGVISIANLAGVPVVCDPKGADFAKYRSATLITPNRAEAALATGVQISSGDRAAVQQAGARLLGDLDLASCLITLSHEGMALFQGKRFYEFPAQAREVFDVTGAGDTVVAALAFALGQQDDIVSACSFANAAAGVVVGKVGAGSASLSEIQGHLLQRGINTPMLRKIIERRDIEAICGQQRAAGRRVVFTNGCFDVLHAGHVTYLERAARLGDVLVLGLNSDASVKRLKGDGRPVNEERDRASILAGLGFVDYVALFDEDTPAALIEQVSPDVLVKGGDYEPDQIVGGDFVRARGGEVVTIPLIEGRSTSATIDRIKRTAS